jgi:hypothetical protein
MNMDSQDSMPAESLWQEDYFRFIKPEEFTSLGIDPSDIPLGTLPAQKHPFPLPSRFGGNAYGFGLFEFYDRLKPKDIKLLQRIIFEKKADVRRHYKQLNDIYRKIGLLIRLSSKGKPYYLIPVHLVSAAPTHIQAKLDEISYIISDYGRKYFKEYLRIGLIADQDDLLPNELSLRFKEHHFLVLDSLEALRNLNETLDLIILTQDIYEIVLTERLSKLSQEAPSKRRLDQYATYILWKLYNLLNQDGEFYVIVKHHTPKTNQTAKIRFKTQQEAKNFALFAHTFKTKKRYRITVSGMDVNVFDFHKYLVGLYVEQEVVEKLLGRKSLEDMTLERLNRLPYVDFQLSDWKLLTEQKKNWSALFSNFFDTVFLRPIVPETVKEEWRKRFSFSGFTPNYMISYLGHKKRLKTTIAEVEGDVISSGITGCTKELLPDYRDSFEYVIRTLSVLEELKAGGYERLPQVFIELLKQPLETKNRRFSALNDVIKLIGKMHRLKRMRDYLNPDNVEGPYTKVFDNLECLVLFGFSHDELKEILYITLGHTPLGRIISGKSNEKSLKPISDLARAYDWDQASSLLRYCCLMTLAEIEAAVGSELTESQLAELFSLYESTVRVVTHRDLDWENFLDETISSMGGIHNKIVRKLLKMINHFEFLDNWQELRQKGQMEKESLADYDEAKQARIENVIHLVNRIEQLEEMYLQSEPLQLPVFYRKFLDMQFHGTVRVFEKMDSSIVFTILWIAVDVARGDTINFNPILAHLETIEIADWIKHVEQEVRAINVGYLDAANLRLFSDQLYEYKSSFIVGTGIQFRADPNTKALKIACMDMDKDMTELESLSRKFTGTRISEIPKDDLKKMEVLFSNLESFYQSHLRLLGQKDSGLDLPPRQTRWFKKSQDLRSYLRTNFLSMMFYPEEIYNDLSMLYSHAPTILDFVLPEFTALQNLELPWHLYMKLPVTHYIITAASKFQALVRHEHERFQDPQFFHRLAQREFGAMATGIVGVSASQIEVLEGIVESLSHKKPLFHALVKSFIFQDVGRVPALRAKYKQELNPADVAESGALLLEKEDIAERYGLNEKEKGYLIFLVRHHGLLHHIVRGELSFYAIQNIIDPQDRDLFDAFFLLSFIMLSSIREDLILEDLADQLLQIRVLCHKIIGRQMASETYLNEIFGKRGKLFFAVEAYKTSGLPDGVTPADYLECWDPELEEAQSIQAGRKIYSMERLLRLRGIRYVEFFDLAQLILKVPVKFTYKRCNFSSIGYATFEKEIFEAFRIFNTLQNLPEAVRDFILDQLVEDKVRIFAYENVSGYLSYENQIKLLLIGLLGGMDKKVEGSPVSLNFISISEKIENRYEAVNDFLNALSVDKLWEDRDQVNQFFRDKTGLVLRREAFPNVLTIDFQDKINILQKITHMDTIDDVDQLKNYFHYSLLSLRKHPSYTEDYELQLEKAFEKRLVEITDMILDQTKKQMDLIRDFKELHNLVADLNERSYDLGFSEDQKHRLNDLYELRKDILKREKLLEIDNILSTIHDANELNDYWDSVKWYLQNNRRFFGKEFEILISKEFDAVRMMIYGKM